MEKRKDTLSAIKLCRFCLSRDENLQSLYDRSKETKNSVSLPLKILSCMAVEIFPSDKMPTYICSRCTFFMNLFYDYKQICRRADESILQYVQSGTALESIVWTPSLVKMFRYGAKPVSDVGIVKTVVEGGATVEVTSQEVSDSDDGEENVYDVKIGDGSDEGSARIKVVTSKDNQNSKNVSKTTGQGFSSVSKLTRHVRSHAGERGYPCKYCNKSFIKSHHYRRHLRIKHRDLDSRLDDSDFRVEQYRCEQCEDTFATQDDLIYHSAIHATQNLTCPLCQEKFENVDAVTVHIKSHVNGVEFMCDYCELVFTSKEKLDLHISATHGAELQLPVNYTELGQNESSMEMDAEDDEDENTINLKEEDDHMVVEIKKAEDFMITNTQLDSEEKVDNTNSEESESETTYMELSTVDTLAMISKESPKTVPEKPTISLATVAPAVKTEKSNDNQTVSILQKAEEIKRKVVQQQTSDSASIAPEKKVKPINKVESSSGTGANDKSLRLLEKELQELKRTNPRNEIPKTPVKSAESLRSSRRPQLHTSTPKLRPTDEKKSLVSSKPVVTDKKNPERRAVKENKEPKEVKESKSNNGAKEEKEAKVISTPGKEEKETNENETPKSVVKNGATDKSNSEEGVRRSTRPSKIKDYAKMIRDRSQAESDDDTDDDDEEYVESEKLPESRPKTRRATIKLQPKTPKTSVVATPGAKKRGRPRKEPAADVPAKIKKNEDEENEVTKTMKSETEDNIKIKNSPVNDSKADSEIKSGTDESSNTDDSKTLTDQKPPGGMLVSPTGQTLKKVPIKALPPGVKPLPLPVNARPMGPGELCEMQIGKKVVKVQKIVMTKAEVEAMAKKGLVEMKDGTMVLKQGIKIPTLDPHAIKSTLVGDEVGKDSPTKKDKGTPTRCDLGEDA